MVNKTRAERRHFDKKKKDKARRLAKEVFMMKEDWITDTFVGRLARTPVPCSDICCGNPRHHHGNGAKTLAEIKSELEFQEEMELFEQASTYDFFEFEKTI